MKPKIILVNGSNETHVATFKALNECLQCAALLQAFINSDNYTYFVEHRHKGQIKRTKPDPFATLVNCSTHLHNLIKSIKL